MVLWHVAGTLFLFRWIFRDPKVDVRFLVAGALLPDAADMAVGTLLLADRFARGELWLHSLVAPAAVMAAVLLATRRGRRRRAWMALAIGMLFHLALDGMWADTRVFLWPVSGWELPRGSGPYWNAAWERALSDPWRWVKEAAALAYLAALWRRAGLSEPGARQQLVRTGRLAARV